jgi:hypothetical protein
MGVALQRQYGTATARERTSGARSLAVAVLSISGGICHA